MKLEGIYSLYDKGILKDINFEFALGKFYYVVVKNIEIVDAMVDILGLMAPIMEGLYFINGEEVSGASYAKKTNIRKNNMGFIFRYLLFDNDLTVYENLLLPLVNNKNMNSAAKKRLVDDILIKYNLQSLALKNPKYLSRYDAQMVTLVRAVINKPKFIVASDPTDLMNEKEEEAYYKELANLTKKGIGVIIISTRVKMKNLADKIYWYENKLM